MKKHLWVRKKVLFSLLIVAILAAPGAPLCAGKERPAADQGFGLKGSAKPAERDSSFVVGSISASFSF